MKMRTPLENGTIQWLRKMDIIEREIHILALEAFDAAIYVKKWAKRIDMYEVAVSGKRDFSFVPVADILKEGRRYVAAKEGLFDCMFWFNTREKREYHSLAYREWKQLPSGIETALESIRLFARRNNLDIGKETEESREH